MTVPVTSLWELLRDDQEPEPLTYVAGEPGEMRLGFKARIFLERGADESDTQRNQALAASRNLLAIGMDAGEVVEQIWTALEMSPQLDAGRPWLKKDAEKIVANIAKSPPTPMKPMEPAGELIIDTGVMVDSPTEDEGFRFSFPKQRVVLEVSRVVVTSQVMRAWVRAEVGGEEVGAAECELRTSAGASGMWRFFEKWDAALPWAQMLEKARREVLKARREGGTVLSIGDVGAPERTRLRVAPLIVNRHLNVIFATGGSGKSLLMLLLASLVQEGRAHAGMTVEPGNVLYLDWEQGAEDAKGTLDALAAGMGGFGSFSYMRCTSTLVEMAEEIGRIIVERDIAVVMIDSLTFALGGDKNDAQTVTAGTNAMRLWREGTTTVALDHIAKPERGKARTDPFGSVFVRNAARNLLKIEAWMDVENHELHQVIEQMKTNKGVLPVFGLKYTFEPESFNPSAIFVQEENPPFDIEAQKVRDKPIAEKVARAPQRQKVYVLIKTAADRMWSKTSVAEALGISPETARSALIWLTEEGMLYEVKGSGTSPNTYGTTGA